MYPMGNINKKTTHQIIKYKTIPETTSIIRYQDLEQKKHSVQ
jgi:hypothetical protein